jgi:ABC-2 type transport system permease protein
MSASTAPRSPGRIRRVTALVRKESYQIARDPSSILMAGVLPLVLLFLFGFGISLDLLRVPVGLVVEVPTTETGSFTESLVRSTYFDVRKARDRRAFEDDLVAGRVKGIVVLASDFSERLNRSDTAPVQLIVDGSDPNTGSLILNYVQGVWRTWLFQETLEKGARPRPPVSIEARYWFNPEVDSRKFLVPGGIAVIMTLVGTLLTALVVAREWERGTMEALLATPVGRLELLLGKVIPYFALGMASMALSAAAAVLGFGVPLRGSILWLLGVSAAFLLPMVAFGLLISTRLKNQFTASQAALVAAFLPTLLLSGFIFEIESMPAPVRLLTHVVPARYFVTCLETIFLAGDVPSVLVPNTLVLLAMGAGLFVLLARSTRLNLE